MPTSSSRSHGVPGLLMIHPLVLGSGRRLFPEGVEATLRLAQGVITSAGVVIASYEPATDST